MPSITKHAEYDFNPQTPYIEPIPNRFEIPYNQQMPPSPSIISSLDLNRDSEATTMSNEQENWQVARQSGGRSDDGAEAGAEETRSGEEGAGGVEEGTIKVDVKVEPVEIKVGKVEVKHELKRFQHAEKEMKSAEIPKVVNISAINNKLETSLNGLTITGNSVVINITL